MSESLEEYCVRYDRRELLAQWHPDKNAPLGPSMVLPGSTKRVWWRCGYGHEWKAVVYSWTGAQKCGCPVCAGKQLRKCI